MTFNIYNLIRMDYFVTILSIALLLILPNPILSKSPLASIPTHHGINLDSLHLNERGGAVATRRRHWKKYYPNTTHTLPRSDDASSVSTSFSVESVVEKYKESVAAAPTTAEVSEETTAVVNKPTSQTKQQPSHQQDSALSPTAITCMSLLALQFGIQPILVRKYTPQAINRSSVVLVQELVKFGIAGAIYFSGTKKEVRDKDLMGKFL